MGSQTVVWAVHVGVGSQIQWAVQQSQKSIAAG